MEFPEKKPSILSLTKSVICLSHFEKQRKLLDCQQSTSFSFTWHFSGEKTDF